MRISDWSSDVCSSDLTACQIAATAHDLGLAAWVRIPEREYGVIGRVLDSGATGIIAPKIETEAEARLLAAACRFPPVGQRSMIARIPQTGFVRSPVNERSEEHTSELQSLMLIAYAVFCLKKKTKPKPEHNNT